MSATPGLIVAAPASGSGKTTVTLAVLRALRDAGVRVASCKVGPDYIDPAFHAAATGRPCLNLDPWAMRPATLASLAVAAGRDADLVVAEGVMGLFDGARDDTGSTADLAALTGWPVLLVIDAGGQAASAAAVAHGFATFRPDVEVAGLVFNRIGGPAHAEMLRRSAEKRGFAVLGSLPRRDDLALPDRHLGLVQALEHPDLETFLGAAAAWADEHLSLGMVRQVARPGRLEPAGAPAVLPPPGQRIALARDDAFAFAYPHVIESWRHAGAEIVPFSPLADEAPAAAADAVILPGGYPELHAGRLAANARFLDGLRRAARNDAAVYGECGGYMVLGQGMVDAEGTRHPMAGLLGVETSFADRRLHLGYRHARTRADTWLGPAGTALRGHEFHYASTVSEAPAEPLFVIADATMADLGTTGERRGNVTGSFVHLVDAA